ncbi:MAG: sugar ABC transporter substrate-binding protein [Solirubrobacterales bacterium]
MSKKIVLRLWAPLLLVALIVLVVAGCGSSSSSSSSSTASSESSSSGESGSSEASGEAPKAAVLYHTLTDFTTPQIAAEKKVIEAAGGTIQDFNANFDPQKQLTQCQDAITSQRYNVIIIAAADSPSAVPCAEQAKAAGIPVIAVNNPVGPSRTEVAPQLEAVLGSSVISPPDDAKYSFEIAEKACKGIAHCKWAIEMGEGSAPLDSTRTKELEEDAEKSSNIEIVQVTEAGYDPGKTAELVPQVLSANPELDVYSFESDTNALAAVPAVKEAGLTSQVKLIGDGASVAGIEGVKNGSLFGTVASFPVSMGEEAARMAVEAVQKGAVENNAVNMFELGEPLTIYKDNAAGFEPQWGEG